MIPRPYWNFYFFPEQFEKYTKEEVDEELIDNVKAFHMCRDVAEIFAQCRKMPLGKVVEPESCISKAYVVLKCYNQVKIVPENCKQIHSSLKTCMNKKNNTCRDIMDEYISCKHPQESIFKVNSITNNEDTN